MVFDIYVEDEECLATLELLAATCPAATAAGVNDALEEAKGMAEEEVKVDTGHTKASIGILPATPTEIFDAELHAMSEYASAVEWNTVPHTPPLEELMGWAERHNPGGISTGRFAYYVQQKIKERGTTGKPYIAYLADEKLPELLELHLLIAYDVWSNTL